VAETGIYYPRPVLIEPRDPRDPVIVQLSREQQAELAAAEGAEHIAYPLHDGIEFVAGFVDGRPIACGALQPLGDGVGELKRMYVRPAHRRQGLSRLILAALEELAVQRGYHTLRLETGRFFAPALRLYQAAGYRPIPLFGEYVGNPRSVCFEKSLAAVEVG
jgi:GNAT superfamily N-acetyltransferase